MTIDKQSPKISVDGEDIIFRVTPEKMICESCGKTEQLLVRTISIKDGKSKLHAPWLQEDYLVHCDAPVGWHRVWRDKHHILSCKACYVIFTEEWEASRKKVVEGWLSRLKKAITG